MPALFLVILTEQALVKSNRVPILIGLVMTILCRWIFGPDQMLIIAILCILVALLVGRRWLDKPVKKEAENGI